RVEKVEAGMSRQKEEVGFLGPFRHGEARVQCKPGSEVTSRRPPRACLLGFRPPGEVSEWLKEHAWKACVRKTYRGFESPPLRHEISGAQRGFRNRRTGTRRTWAWRHTKIRTPRISSWCAASSG